MDDILIVDPSDNQLQRLLEPVSFVRDSDTIPIVYLSDIQVFPQEPILDVADFDIDLDGE